MKRYGILFLTLAILLPLFSGTFTAYASEAVSITITADKTVLVPGQETPLTITTTPAGMDYTLTSSDTSVLEVYANTRSAYAVSKGTAVVTASCTSSTGQVYSATVTIKVRTPTGIVSGEDYYVMNVATTKYLSLQTASDANNVAVNGRARSSSTNTTLTRWTANNVRTDGTGLTQLQSVYSSTGRNLYVSGTSLVIYNASTSRTKFAIHRIESGTHQGQYAIRYGSQYVAMNSSGTVYLTSSSSANIYWCFMAVNEGSAALFGFDYTDAGGHFFTLGNRANFGHYLSNYNTSVYTNSTASIASQCLKNGDIFWFFGHGDPGVVYFDSSEGNTTGSIAVLGMAGDGSDKIVIWQFENNELASQRCTFYIGCRSGVDYMTNTNLIDATFDKGAHFVLGIREIVTVGASEQWLQHFLVRIYAGDSINAACDYATSETGRVWIKNYSTNEEYYIDEYPIYTVGDGSQYLN